MRVSASISGSPVQSPAFTTGRRTASVNVHRSSCQRFPRGFPLGKRWQDERWTFTEAVRRPVVNAGLWTGDPDIDALTRIYFPVEASLPLSHDYVTLAHGCWCPINTQNTA